MNNIWPVMYLTGKCAFKVVGLLIFALMIVILVAPDRYLQNVLGAKTDEALAHKVPLGAVRTVQVLGARSGVQSVVTTEKGAFVVNGGVSFFNGETAELRQKTYSTELCIGARCFVTDHRLTVE